MSSSSDPGWGGQQPDDRSREGQPDGGAAAPQPGGPPGPYQQYQPGQYPQQGPYSQPPGQYQPPAHGLPYGDRGGYVYSPYGSQPAAPYPAGLPDARPEPVARPPIMVLALVLLVLSTVNSIIGGVYGILRPDELVLAVPPEQLDELRAQGVSPESILAGFAAVILGIALLFVLFSVLAFTGRNWARIVVTIMTVGFALLALVGLGLTPVDQGPLALLTVVAAVVGSVIFFLPGPRRYFAARHR